MRRYDFNAGAAQLIEHQPSKLRVEGLSPFSRSKSLSIKDKLFFYDFWGDSRAAKWGRL